MNVANRRTAVITGRFARLAVNGDCARNASIIREAGQKGRSLAVGYVKMR